MDSSVSDEVAIRNVVETWAVARDAGLWEDLLGTWHEDGRMHTTWCDAPRDDFVDAVRKIADQGKLAHHFLGGTKIELAGDRAIAQAKTTISARLEVDGVECDLTCWGRFYDFFERREDRWAIVLRQPIYEKDRIDPVYPGAILDVDRDLLDGFPSGCRWLLYALKKAGLPVITAQIGASGPMLDQLYADGAAWLQGSPAPNA
jgi:hypothetical protein